MRSERASQYERAWRKANKERILVLQKVRRNLKRALGLDLMSRHKAWREAKGLDNSYMGMRRKKRAN